MKTSYAVQLADRIATPSLINQGDSSLCGPAAFLYALATKDPIAYASYAIDLYQAGRASIGRLKVVPGDDCKNAVPINIDAVDWVTLAGLRDSSNILLDYQSSSDEAAGITMPGGLSGWFERSGLYTNIVDDTNLVLDKGLSSLVMADQKRSAANFPCLFVSANGISGKLGGSWTPDHWVVLASPVMVGGTPASSLLARGSSIDSDKSLLGQTLSFQIFTWGRIRQLPRLTTSSFLDYYYGFVSAK